MTPAVMDEGQELSRYAVCYQIRGPRAAGADECPTTQSVTGNRVHKGQGTVTVAPRTGSTDRCRSSREGPRQCLDDSPRDR